MHSKITDADKDVLFVVGAPELESSDYFVLAMVVKDKLLFKSRDMVGLHNCAMEGA